MSSMACLNRLAMGRGSLSSSRASSALCKTRQAAGPTVSASGKSSACHGVCRTGSPGFGLSK
eukprot:scaffold18049_cov48-Prasinocladus_malaysianus.AAC.1